MPVYVGDASIEGGSSAFTVKDNVGTTVFAQGVSAGTGGNFGYYTTAQVPGFIAGSSSDPGWVWQGPASAWSKSNIYATNVIYNRGNCYSPSETRFTAPITGPYLFIWGCYAYTANYFHPQFAVNGNVDLRRGTCPYRIRGYGMAANYQQDGQTEELIYLTAGDYVELHTYSGGITYYYQLYSLFAGFFAG